MEEEIDLRIYIAVLLKHWPWIVGLSLVAALAAFTVSSILPPTYEAEAKVIILKSKTDISFEPTIRNESEDKVENIAEVQQTLLTLVESSDVAAMVLPEIKDLLPSESQNILTLLKKVEAANTGNVISIKVTDKDPVVAAQLADRWANTYTSYVNQLFNDRSNTLLAQVEAQVAEVENSYRLAQANLENFLSQSQIVVLERGVESVKQNLGVKYKLLEQKYNELNRIDQWLADAQTVRDQLSAPSSSPGANVGDLLALTGLREQGASRGAPVQLQLNLAEIDGDIVTPEDAAVMTAVIAAYKARTEADIEALSAELALAGDGAASAGSREQEAATNPLVARLLVLQKALEIQKAQERELLSARNLAWENYVAVQRKLAEVTLQAQIPDSQVRFASHAIIPDDPISPRRLLNTVIGGALGFMLAVVGVFAVEYWQGGAQVSSEPERAQQDQLAPTS